MQLLDVIQATPGGLYLVFEFVAHDLKTFMDQRQRSDDIRERIGLPKPMVRSFMRQILNGVGYCHTHRVLHRDLKPHNVSVYSLVIHVHVPIMFFLGSRVVYFQALIGVRENEWVFMIYNNFPVLGRVVVDMVGCGGIFVLIAFVLN